MKNLYLIGGGGHCKSCIDVIEQTGEFNIKGIFDIKEMIGDKVLGYEVIGTDDDIKSYQAEDNYFLITLGQIKTPNLRIKLFNLDLQFATVISPRAYVSKHANVGAGSIIMHDALVNAGASIGKNCIVNSKALVEHDAVVGDHCHISTAAIINGNCVVGEKSFIGSNTTLKNGIKINANSVIPYGVKV
jgi:sugar O-acyltransferase (sialic acid O-acetyltransferase NeuD family)